MDIPNALMEAVVRAGLVVESDTPFTEVADNNDVVIDAVCACKLPPVRVHPYDTAPTVSPLPEYQQVSLIREINGYAVGQCKKCLRIFYARRICGQ